MRHVKKPQLQTKKVIIVTVIVLIATIATVGLLVYLRILDEKTVNIDGTRIDRKEYGVMQADAKTDPSFAQDDERSKEIIAISVKAEEISKKYKLGITQEMLDQRSKTIFNKEWPDLNAWQRSAVESATLMDYAYFLSKGGSELYIYEFPFAASYATDIKDAGKNAQAIAVAQQKAEQDAEKLRSELPKDKTKAGTLTIKLRNDATYAEGYGFAMNPSRWFFMTDDAKTYEGGMPEDNKADVDEQVAQQAKTLKVGEISEVLLRTGLMPVDPRVTSITLAEKPISFRVIYLHKKVSPQKDVYNQVKKEVENMKIEDIK